MGGGGVQEGREARVHKAGRGQDLQAKLDNPPREGNAKENDFPRVGCVRRQKERRQSNEAIDVSKHDPVHAAEGQNLPAGHIYISIYGGRPARFYSLRVTCLVTRPRRWHAE